MKRHSSNSTFLRHERCPDCGSSDALSVYTDGHTYCFSCNAYHHGERAKALTVFEGGEEGESLAEKHPGCARAEKQPSSHLRLILEGVYQALPKRHLQEITLSKFGYTVGSYLGSPVHIAPYYDRTGQLVAQHLRFPDKAFKWLGNPRGVQLFGQPLWRDTGGKMLVITEGELDAMSVSQAQDNRYPVVSIPSGAKGAARAIKDNLEFVESYDRVVFAFDNDEAGREAAQECALLLSPGKARICTFPLKDASDMLQAGRVKEIITCIWEAKQWRPDGLIAGKDLWDDLILPPANGYETPYPLLDNMIHGIRKGELYLFTAGSGIGKSTMVNEIGYHFLMRHGLSIGIIALEESRKRTAERYVGMTLDRPIHIDRDGLDETEIREAFDKTLNNDRFWLYDHFGSTDLDNLIAKIRHMIVAFGVDFVILDHISIVVSGLDDIAESERKLIDKLMTRLRTLIEETGAGVLAVVHLKRPDGGKSYNEGRQVSLTDLRGSGALEQLSDVVIAIERNQQSEDGEEQNRSLVRVLKNRPVGTVGECDTLEYDPDTGRLSAVPVFTAFDAAPAAPTAKKKKEAAGKATTGNKSGKGLPPIKEGETDF